MKSLSILNMQSSVSTLRQNIIKALPYCKDVDVDGNLMCKLAYELNWVREGLMTIRNFSSDEIRITLNYILTKWDVQTCY